MPAVRQYDTGMPNTLQKLLNQRSAGLAPDDSRGPVRPAPKVDPSSLNRLSASFPFTPLHRMLILCRATHEKCASDSNSMYFRET